MSCHKLLLLTTLWIGLQAELLKAQNIEYDWQAEHWGAIFFTHRINDLFSVWHDYHFATNAFYIIRPGLMYHLNKNTYLAGGYAFVATATPFTQRIIRDEHRLWLQYEQRIPYKNKVTFRNRFRYEGRWRRALGESELLDDFVFNHRVRYMGSARIFLQNNAEDKWKWHINPMAELLWFVKDDISHVRSDQNRYYLLPGCTRGNSTLLFGYYARALPMANERRVIRHGGCIWFFQAL